MKVGRVPEEDPLRVAAARAAIGAEAKLFVDAQGVYAHQEALAMASLFADAGVTWFEEPVGADGLEGFHGHVRIEQQPFEGARAPSAGLLGPDPSRPGLGLVFKRQDASAFAV